MCRQTLPPPYLQTFVPASLPPGLPYLPPYLLNYLITLGCLCLVPPPLFPFLVTPPPLSLLSLSLSSLFSPSLS